MALETVNADAAAAAVAVADAPAAEPIMLIEEIDENHVPTQEEVLEAADWLGIDAENDADLLWIAKDFIKAPMPSPWVPYEGSTPDEIFYFNHVTAESTWDHPCDDMYRQLYAAEKIKKAPVKVITVSFETFEDRGAIEAACTSMSGDRVATLPCDLTQTFAVLKATIAETVQCDVGKIRLVTRCAAVPDDDDTVALHVA